MITLVTGATGFIGAHLARLLLERGETVRVLVRNPDGLSDDLRDRLDVVTGDLTDAPSVTPAVEGVSTILHLGGATHALRRKTYFRINTEGTANLVRAVLRTSPPIRRFLLTSSIAAAGPSRGSVPLVETDPPAPCTPYGESKLEAEEILREAGDRIPYTIVRPPIVYGPGDRATLEFFKAARLRLHPVSAPCDRHYSIIHAADLVRGILMASDADRAAGETYFLCHPETTTWNEMMLAIHRAMGTGRRIRFTLSDGALRFASEVGEMAQGWFGINLRINRSRVGEFIPKVWVSSPDKAREDFGYTAEIPLEDGFRETAAWYREQGWL